MRVEPLGDSAFILRELDAEPWQIARALNEQPAPGLIEAVASYETVGLYVDPVLFDIEALRLPEASSCHGRAHVIPVCYELGEDLEWVARQLGITEAEVMRLHTSIEYRCYALGFCPGFAYLGYLPAAIAGLPRLDSPRLAVEPGSVGITGRQTAVYPLERPGGWRLIGKTPLTLVDEDYFPIEAGDTVRFTSIERVEFEARRGERL
jgi:KipI family sensor histidine kinase inhibitor